MINFLIFKDLIFKDNKCLSRPMEEVMLGTIMKKNEGYGIFSWSDGR